MSSYLSVEEKNRLIQSMESQICQLERDISKLKSKNFDKECKIEDLRLLLLRISTETCFVKPYSQIINKREDKQLDGKVRKISGDSYYSLSKNFSTSTQAVSINCESKEDDDISEYTHDRSINLQLNYLNETEYNCLQAKNHSLQIFNFWRENINPICKN